MLKLGKNRTHKNKKGRMATTSVHPNETLIQKLYKGLQTKDGEAMASCYHPDAHFSDPMFPSLKGTQVGDMWRMLSGRSKNEIKVEVTNIKVDDNKGSAHWEAWYAYDGRSVHNIIDATYEFKDGLIIRHIDSFDLYAWEKQALGFMGTLLGWTSFMQGSIRAKVATSLENFSKKRAESKDQDKKTEINKNLEAVNPSVVDD